MTHSDNVAEAIRKWCELPAESSDELPVRMSTILEFARSAYSGIVGEDGSSELCNAHQRIIEKALPRILSSEMGWSWLVTGGESSGMLRGYEGGKRYLARVKKDIFYSLC